jgi:hypothetical protein
VSESVQALIRRLYEYETCEATGGPLHIVVEEGAVEDETLDYCERTLATHWSVEEASAADRVGITETAQAIIDALRAMTPAQRRKAIAS